MTTADKFNLLSMVNYCKDVQKFADGQFLGQLSNYFGAHVAGNCGNQAFPEMTRNFQKCSIQK
jgi:hypothetical protein